MGGGETGIRTPGTLSRSTVFKTAAFDHSATSPSEQGFRRAVPDWQAKTLGPAGWFHRSLWGFLPNRYQHAFKAIRSALWCPQKACDTSKTGEPGKWAAMVPDRARKGHGQARNKTWID